MVYCTSPRCVVLPYEFVSRDAVNESSWSRLRPRGFCTTADTNVQGPMSGSLQEWRQCKQTGLSSGRRVRGSRWAGRSGRHLLHAMDRDQRQGSFQGAWGCSRPCSRSHSLRCCMLPLSTDRGIQRAPQPCLFYTHRRRRIGLPRAPVALRALARRRTHIIRVRARWPALLAHLGPKTRFFGTLRTHLNGPCSPTPCSPAPLALGVSPSRSCHCLPNPSRRHPKINTPRSLRTPSVGLLARLASCNPRRTSSLQGC